GDHYVLGRAHDLLARVVVHGPATNADGAAIRGFDPGDFGFEKQIEVRVPRMSFQRGEQAGNDFMTSAPGDVPSRDGIAGPIDASFSPVDERQEGDTLAGEKVEDEFVGVLAVKPGPLAGAGGVGVGDSPPPPRL